MKPPRRVTVALVAALISATHGSAQSPAQQITTIVEEWVQEEASHFIGELRQYLSVCISPIASALPDNAQQAIVGAGTMYDGLEALRENDPAIRDQFLADLDPCITTASTFGGIVLDWVFVTQMQEATREELLSASFCVMNVIRGLDNDAWGTIILSMDIRDAGFRTHGIAGLNQARPEQAETLNAAIDGCVTG
ncbi:MAG: hypothetical protein ACTSWI_04130 [Alphaproteobacteria bacterium]